MRATVVPGVEFWSVFQPDRGLDFNGFFVETAEGNFVVDPIAPDEATLATLRERGVKDIVITNRDHERATAAVAAATGAQVVASEHDAPLLTHRVDRIVRPGDLVHGWMVMGFTGLKTTGEIALVDRTRRAAIVGDAIWGAPAGALTLMPDAKLGDAAEAARSLRQLRAAQIDHLLVGDGACAFGNASALLDAMFDARPEAGLNHVRLDELRFRRGADDRPPFTAGFAEAGRLLGAEKLSYAVGELRTGDHYCPVHWHTAEEELFVVLRGTPSVRTPRGTTLMQPGDMMAFRTNERDAHRLFNDAAETAVVLLVAHADEHDVCFYPESRKLLVEKTDTLVRAEPQLDYYDGETS